MQYLCHKAKLLIFTFPSSLSFAAKGGKKSKGTTTSKPKYRKSNSNDDDEEDDGSYKPKYRKSNSDEDDEEDDGSYKPSKSRKVRVGQYVSGGNLFTVQGGNLNKGHLELAAASVRSVCPKARGLFAHAEDCSMFYQCYDGEVLMKTCPAGLLFDEHHHMCAQGRDVDCGARRAYSPPPPHPSDPNL